MVNSTFEELEKRRLCATSGLITFVRYCLVFPLVLIGIPFAVLTGAGQELFWAMLMALIVLLYNTVGYFYLMRKGAVLRVREIRLVNFSELIADVFVFTYLIHLSGGIVSPYMLFYFLPVVACGFLFPEVPWIIPILSSVITVCYVTVVGLEYFHVLPMPRAFLWMEFVYGEPIRVITSAVLIPLSIWLLTLFTAQATLLIRKSRESVKQDIESQIGDIKAQLDDRLNQTIEELDKKEKELSEALQERKRTEETMDRFTLVREMDLIDLKREVNQLLKSAGRPPKYDI